MVGFICPFSTLFGLLVLFQLFLGLNGFFSTLPSLNYIYRPTICIVQESAESYSQFQLLLKTLFALLSKDFLHSKHFYFARNYWTLTKYLVIFNQPTDRLNCCILTSDFLRSCHFVTMTSSRGWRQRGCLYPPIRNCNTMVRGYFLEFMP